MVGGGIRARPGEASLAHNGVLFLDELPEFTPQVLEFAAPAAGKRRDRHRARQLSHQLPLAPAADRGDEPLPLRHGRRAGPCLPARPALRRRLPGAPLRPFLDRIDIRIEVPAVTAADLILPAPSEPSAAVAKRVAAARAIQAERYAGLGVKGVTTNAQCAPSLIETVAEPDAAAVALLRSAAEAMRLSARGYHRVLKVARTLADLDGADTVGRIHLAEALSYRVVGDRLAAAA